jgi:rhamnogalacturonyl hydrolase YesR
MALIDVLDYLPKSHAGYGKLLGYMKSLAVGVKAAQDASGGWWLVMDAPYPGMKGNYIESSATAMFTASFLKAIRLGYIDSATYLATAKKAYSLMTTKFVAQNGTKSTLNWEGTVSVGSLGSNGSYEVCSLGTLLNLRYIFRTRLTSHISITLECR